MSIDSHGFFSADVERFRQKIREGHTEYFLLAGNLLALCHVTRLPLEVKMNDVQSVCATALFLKLVGDSEAALLLLERGMTSQGRSLARVGAECLIVLASMCQSPDFVKSYEMSGERGRYRLVSAIRDNPSHHFDKLRQQFTEEVVTDIKKAFNGTKEEKIKMWAENANMSSLYDGMYRMFSAEVHSAPVALEHYLIMEDRLPTGFQYGPDFERDFRHDLLELCRLLIYGLAHFGKLLKIDIDERLRNLKVEYDRLGELAVKHLS